MTPTMHRFAASFTAAAGSAEVIQIQPPMDTQDWLWLVTKASHQQPLGYELAYFYLVLERDLDEIALLLKVSELWLQQQILAYFDTLEHLIKQEQLNAN